MVQVQAAQYLVCPVWFSRRHKRERQVSDIVSHEFIKRVTLWRCSLADATY